MEIATQTDRLLIIRREGSTRGWCRECGREREMVSLGNAATIAGTSLLLPGAAASHGWHVSEDRNGSPLVCLESLLKSQ
jgi:hypothetical protein